MELPSAKNRMSYSLARVNQFSSEYVTTMAATAFGSYNTKVTGNLVYHPKRHAIPCSKPTAYMTSHPLNKPSNGCMLSVVTPSSPHDSKRNRLGSLWVGPCCLYRTSRSTTPKPPKVLKAISTKHGRMSAPPNQKLCNLRNSNLCTSGEMQNVGHLHHCL